MLTGHFRLGIFRHGIFHLRTLHQEFVILLLVLFCAIFYLANVNGCLHCLTMFKTLIVVSSG